MTVPRLIVANLDCEQDWAAPGVPRPLPAPVSQRISALGALLAAFGMPGDRVWTPAPVAPERVAEFLARGITFVSGDIASHAAGSVLCWGETARTAALRAGASLPEQPESWLARLWHLRPDPAIARRCNDRRTSFALCQALGLSLPGAALLGSVAELERHLAAGHHEHGHAGAWVLEAPFSASGRLRLRRRGAALDAPSRTRAERMFAEHGALVFQPWVDRVLDLGCVGIVEDEQRWQLMSPHWLETDAAGVFRGIGVSDWPWPRAWGQGLGDIVPEAVSRVRLAAEHVARFLAGSGYRGPFGIDSFVYREQHGALRVYPLCEINARLTFGLVAHALARNHGALRLRLRSDAAPAASPSIVPLLAAAPHEPTTAWLELEM